MKILAIYLMPAKTYYRNEIYDTSPDYSDLARSDYVSNNKPVSLAQLQRMCYEKHISIDGNQHQLVLRLLKYDEEMAKRPQTEVGMRAISNDLKEPLIDEGDVNFPPGSAPRRIPSADDL